MLDSAHSRDILPVRHVADEMKTLLRPQRWFAAAAPMALLACANPSEEPESPANFSGRPENAPQIEGTENKSSAAANPTQNVQLRFPRAAAPWLGVELRATDPGKAGVQITRVLSGSPAERAGLRAGDVITQLGDDPVTEPVEIADWVVRQDAGTEHPISLLRDDEPKLLRVVLEGRPEFEDRLRLELVGRRAPEIAGVATFQGEASSLHELRGRVVVLEFWASFCGVCRFLGPRLDEWHRTYQPQGAEVVGITVDPPHLGLRVAARSGMSYTLASDPEAKITETYLASQIPVVVIIDRKGIVRDAMVGYSERRISETEALIEQLIQQGS